MAQCAKHLLDKFEGLNLSPRIKIEQDKDVSVRNPSVASDGSWRQENSLKPAGQLDCLTRQ